MTGKLVLQLDTEGYFIGLAQAVASPLEPGVFRLPGGCIDAAAPVVAQGHRAKWNGGKFLMELTALEPTPGADPDPEPTTQFEIDKRRYMRRDAVKGILIAEMAAENMVRVRAGEWTVPELIGLANDPLLVQVQGYMNTLSFELAAQALASSDHPLLTQEIKMGWVEKLQAAFFLN